MIDAVKGNNRYLLYGWYKKTQENAQLFDATAGGACTHHCASLAHSKFSDYGNIQNYRISEINIPKITKFLERGFVLFRLWKSSKEYTHRDPLLRVYLSNWPARGRGSQNFSPV